MSESGTPADGLLAEPDDDANAGPASAQDESQDGPAGGAGEVGADPANPAGGDRPRGPRADRPREPERPRVKVFVEGRYRKLTRDLPQTVFFCPECKGHPRRRLGCARCEGFGKLTRDSVQELVGWVIGAAFKTRRNKFHGAGREDLDVRMLGEGRPFVFELENPKVLDVDLAAVEAEINRRNEGRLEIRGLHWADKSRVRVLKEEPHAKEYEALVALDGPVEPALFAPLVGRRLQVVQQTPARVAHRRADKERERWIEFLAFEPVSDANELRVRLRTEHGTYVKEAIHGEGGATRPSLSELLGVACVCRELDVLAILDPVGDRPPPAAKPLVFGANLLDSDGPV
jgi:tRNA pseudouridine synthase 10